VGLYATYRAYGSTGRVAHEGQAAEGTVLERKIETRRDSNVVGAGRAISRPTESYSLVYRPRAGMGLRGLPSALIPGAPGT
jgi:hypothetical protein